MTNCIRCGAQLAAFDPNRGFFLTADGGYTCPASLRGEAAIHRVANALPPKPPAQKPRGNGFFKTLGIMLLSWEAGKVAGDVMFRQQHGYTPTRTYGPNENVAQAEDFFRQRLRK